VKSTGQIPASAEVQLESWLRAVRHLQAAGLAPVVPAGVSWQLLELHGLIVHGPVELPWTEAA